MKNHFSCRQSRCQAMNTSLQKRMYYVQKESPKGMVWPSLNSHWRTVAQCQNHTMTILMLALNYLQSNFLLIIGFSSCFSQLPTLKKEANFTSYFILIALSSSVWPWQCLIVTSKSCSEVLHRGYDVKAKEKNFKEKKITEKFWSI